MADATPERDSGESGDTSRSTLAVNSTNAVVALPEDDNSFSDNTSATPSSALHSESNLSFHSLPPISLSNRRRSSVKVLPGLTPPVIDTKPSGHRKADSAIEDAAELMLARAKVANDLLFKDPKRVVIEHGYLQADQDTLRSLIDVSSPTLRMPHSRVPEASPEPDSYAVYPEGDERALPGFILSCMTMEELDMVTGAWESALETLSDGDFWRAVISDLDGLSRRAPLHLSAKIRAGIPAAIRGVVWQTLTQARSTYLQTVYTQLVKEYSPHERIIKRDLTRTFPKIPVFKSEGGSGQQRLFRILKAYSLYDAEVGYCQGLGFIIGPLLMSMGECEAFCVLVRLMETYDLRGMFTEDMAGLHLRLYQFQELAIEIAGDVVAHLDRHGVVPAMYVPSWFLSLFAYTMPLSFVLRAMDVIVAEGAPESIMRIGIALLQRNAEHILRQDDFESAMAAVNSGLYDDASNARDRPGYVLQEAAKLSAVVTRQRLDELEAQYCREQGVVLKGRQSTSTQATQVATPTAQQAITKFLGWPWGRDNLTPQTPSARRPRASETGRISPRVLELTEAQQLQSQRLRDQVLLELQTQSMAPATILGGGGEIKTRESAESTKTAVADAASDIDEPPRSAAAQGQRDGAWRDEVLEPLNRQLHDARVTCASHRDALVALQADHELLRAELAAAKADRAELASDNEQLRMLLRRAESATAAADERAEYSGERSKRAEDMLIAARVDLAEADEERALLVRQLSNLRKFIADSGSEEPVERARLFSVDGGSRPTQAQPGRFSISSIGSAIRGAITSPRQQPDPPLMSPPLVLSPPPTARQHSSIPLASLHRSKTTPPGTIIATSPLPSSRNTINSSIIN
ncbi:hypothetical protein GGI19_004252 [Coemansia pectinata]|uniref:Rab-GAP TBC domain-containing protein n=1 Tax=Coemansia pectinata TaxID=1052879 RepID=A0A9W8GSY6_9FUNG|nr:hypothetical protein GGI19_004252 [Coemansia pectinata]